MKNKKRLKALLKIHNKEVADARMNKLPRILLDLKENKLSRDKLIQIISTRYQVAHFFEDMLRLIINIIKNESYIPNNIRTKLLYSAEQNLKEELGEIIEYGGPHQTGREVFLNSLGIDYCEWKKNLGTYEDFGRVATSAKKLLKKLKSLISKGAVEAVSTLWYYENRISLDGINGDYHILLNAFEERFPEFKKEKYTEGDPLWHIASHSNHDEYHAQIAEAGLTECTSISGTEKKIISTCIEAKKVLDTFWNDCYKEIK